jgi:hypothetical protein
MMTEGRDILTNGIEYINSHTVLPNLSIVVQQWGWDVIIYSIYSVMGYIGLYLLSVVEAITITVLLYRLSIKSGGDKPVLAILSIFASMFLVSYYTIRPNALTIILLLLELLVLENYREKGKKRVLLWLVLLTFLEMNLHGSMWVFHFVFILPYVVPALKIKVWKLKDRDYKVLPLLLICIPMAAVLFLNPYGLDGILYLFHSYGSSLNEIGIGELNDILVLSASGLTTIISLLLFVVVCLVKRVPIRAEVLYFWAGTLVLGIVCYRNLYFAHLSFFVLACEVIPAIPLDLPKFHHYVNTQPKLLLALFSCIFVGGLCYQWQYITEEPLITDSDLTPVVAVEYLQENAEEGARVYTEFNFGSYLEWYGYTVYIDARPELYLKSVNKSYDYLLDTIYLKNYTKEDYEALKQYQFEYWAVPNDSFVTAYAACDDDLECVAVGETYKLYKTIG